MFVKTVITPFYYTATFLETVLDVERHCLFCANDLHMFMALLFECVLQMVEEKSSITLPAESGFNV